MTLQFQSIQYHRNGISGAPFHALLFRDPEQGDMLGVVFDEPYHVAVFNLSKLALGNIAFGVNSWRGDVYEPLLRRAIANAATTAEDSEEESPRINPNRKESPMKTYRVTVIVRVVEHYEVPAKSPHEAQELWAEGRLVHTDESALEGIVLKVEAL